MGNGSKTFGLIAGVALAVWGAVASAAECLENQVHLRGDFGEARFSVELAKTRAERNRGLMFRDSMPQSAGMLFIYKEPGTRNFWMKNTFIPLDIIFLDETGTVQRIKSEAEPRNVSRIFGGDNIQFVLEINGGLAEAMGIDEGDELQHPALDQEKAAWPC